MKTVIIKEIRLLNFKGLRDLTVEFDPALTEIYGRNGIWKIQCKLPPKTKRFCPLVLK